MPAVGSASPSGFDDAYMDDDLFDYDAEIPDIDTSIKAPAPLEGSKKDTLGIDEEVKIRKKRIVVKLDEARLMSDAGIPKLRREAPKKLKFRGKGHEYRDTARLLSYYQFWADDLYKKAKFRDTLQIIEKLGHSRSMKDQRLSWIEETKRLGKLSRAGSPGDKGFATDDAGGKTPYRTDEASAENFNDDDLYSLPQPQMTKTDTQSGPAEEVHASSSGALFLPRGAEDTSDDESFGAEPDDDELGALMDIERTITSTDISADLVIDQEKIVSTNAATTNIAPLVDDFEDDMEAMADFGPPDW